MYGHATINVEWQSPSWEQLNKQDGWGSEKACWSQNETLLCLLYLSRPGLPMLLVWKNDVGSYWTDPASQRANQSWNHHQTYGCHWKRWTNKTQQMSIQAIPMPPYVIPAEMNNKSDLEKVYLYIQINGKIDPYKNSFIDWPIPSSHFWSWSVLPAGIG